MQMCWILNYTELESNILYIKGLLVVSGGGMVVGSGLSVSVPLRSKR